MKVSYLARHTWPLGLDLTPFTGVRIGCRNAAAGESGE